MRKLVSPIIVLTMMSDYAAGQVSTKKRESATNESIVPESRGSLIPPISELVGSLIWFSEEEASRDALATRPQYWTAPIDLNSTPGMAIPRSMVLYEIDASHGESKTKSPSLFAPVDVTSQQGRVVAEYGQMLNQRNWYLAGRIALDRDLSRMKANRERVSYSSTSIENIPSAMTKIARRLTANFWVGLSPSWQRIFSNTEKSVEFDGRNSTDDDTFHKDSLGLSLGIEYQSRTLHAGLEYRMNSDADNPWREILLPVRVGLGAGYFIGTKGSYRLSEDMINNKETATQYEYELSIGRQVSWLGWDIFGERQISKIKGMNSHGGSRSDLIGLRFGRGYFKGKRFILSMNYQKFQSETPAKVENKGGRYSVTFSSVGTH